MKRKSKAKECKQERNIEARSDGFSFRVRMKVGETYINETFFSLDDARAYRDLLRAGKSTDRDQEKVLRAKVEKKKAIGLTVSSLFDRYLDEVTVHKKGWKEETYTVKRLQRMSHFANLPVYLVDGDAIERLKRELKKSARPLSDTTVRKYLMLISHLFKVAVTKRWCSDLANPIKTVELPKPSRMRSRRLEADEFEYLATELGKAKNPVVLPLFEFLIETACRRGEALRLRVKDVDLTSKTAKLIDTKNGEDRDIGLSLRAVSIIEGQLKLQKGHDKIVSIHGAEGMRKVFHVTIDSVRSAFDGARSRAKVAFREDSILAGREPRADFLENLRLHDCRREATSRMFEKGLDIMEVSAMTGHKTIAMLRGYTQLRARELAKKLG